MNYKNLQFETLQVHAGYGVDIETRSNSVPVYQTASFQFESCDHAARLFSLEEQGNIYTRIMNPTSTVLENRIAALEGGVGALAVASGHAAQFIALTTLLKQGDNFISSPFLYGGSYNQFKISLQKFGITAKFSQSLDPSEFEQLIDEDTRVIYLETIGNPSFQIPDLESFSLMAKKYKIPVMVDNTFGACGYLCRPGDFGVDVVVESATKWIGGHGNSIGGVIVDTGNYNWGNGFFSQFHEPSEGYHSLKYYETFKEKAFITKARVEGLRDYGPALSPFNSFLFLQGLETLSLRVERQTQNALTLAQWLEGHSNVKKVNYPGLPGNANHAMALKYLRNGFGGVLSFEIYGSKEDTKKVVESLQVVSHVANVGDTKTLIIQPAASTHHQLDEKEQSEAGVSPNLLRVSLGIEHIDDIIYDFEQALKKL